LLQVADRWGSFTAYAFAEGVGRALTIVVDRTDLLTPGIRKLYLVEDDMTIYEGTFDE
jgi:hypothetical protein